MAAKKALPPPTGEQVSQALADLKARILAQMALIPNLIPGSAEWVAVLERRVNNALSGQFIIDLKRELLEELPKLVQGGKGPVTRDDTDIA